MEPTRRDDLESIGHVLLYFLKKARLPWQGLRGATKEEKRERIKNKMKETSIEELCAGLPKEFSVFMEYCRGMSFEQEPDYEYLINLLGEASSDGQEFVNDKVLEEQKVTEIAEMLTNIRVNETHSSKDDLEK